MELDLASEMQLYLGLWERETYPYIYKAAARCAWAVDVGAANGELCLYLLRNSRATDVYAIDPVESGSTQLRRNLGLNKLGSNKVLKVITKFVGCGGGEDTVRLDDLGVDNKKPGFIKIDVDGTELDVLNSATSLLSEGYVDILIETHSSELEYESLKLLSALGYCCEIVKSAWWRILVPEQRPIEHNRWLWATKIEQ